MTRSLLSLFAAPLAVHERTLREFSSTVFREPPAGVNLADDRAVRVSDDDMPTVDDCIVAEGVVLLPLHGFMVKRSRRLWTWHGDLTLLGSDDLAQLVDQFTMRTDLHTLILDVDSGGGSVSGTERLGDAIYRARQSMTVIGVANEFAASGALWAISQCEHVVAPETAAVGSLGVVMIHVDDTKRLSELGIEKSFIHRGKYKGADWRPLNDELRADYQRLVDDTYTMFVDAVARGRGLAPEAVIERWGDSQTFTGREALASGLIDEIGTLQDVLDSVHAGHRGRVSVPAPATEPEMKAPDAMKLNAQGQILNDKGTVVGNVADLNLSADQLRGFFAEEIQSIVSAEVSKAVEAREAELQSEADEARKADHARLTELCDAVGPELAVQKFIEGATLQQAKADLADTLKAQLEAKDKEIADLKATGAKQTGTAPPFAASDNNAKASTADSDDDDPDAPYAAAWNANTDGCQDKFPTLKAYAAFERYQARKTPA